MEKFICFFVALFGVRTSIYIKFLFFLVICIAAENMFAYDKIKPDQTKFNVS